MNKNFKILATSVFLALGLSGSIIHGAAPYYYQVDNAVFRWESDALVGYRRPDVLATFYKKTGKFAATCRVRLRGGGGPGEGMEATPENAKIIFSDLERWYKKQELDKERRKREYEF